MPELKTYTTAIWLVAVGTIFLMLGAIFPILGWIGLMSWGGSIGWVTSRLTQPKPDPRISP